MKKDKQVEQKNTLRRVASASFIGNFVEWFDYAAYGFLATVIAVVFFPQSDPLTALMAAYAIFAISFILRPLGVVSGNGKYSTLRIFTPTSFNDIQHGIFA